MLKFRVTRREAALAIGALGAAATAAFSVATGASVLHTAVPVAVEAAAAFLVRQNVFSASTVEAMIAVEKALAAAKAAPAEPRRDVVPQPPQPPPAAGTTPAAPTA